MSCLELCIALGNYCKLLCLTCNFVFKCKGIRDASFLRHFRIGQIYLILRTTHIHALLHVLSWLHYWLSPLITYFAPPQHTTWLRAWRSPTPPTWAGGVPPSRTLPGAAPPTTPPHPLTGAPLPPPPWILLVSFPDPHTAVTGGLHHATHIRLGGRDQCSYLIRLNFKLICAEDMQ